MVAGNQIFSPGKRNRIELRNSCNPVLIVDR